MSLYCEPEGFKIVLVAGHGNMGGQLGHGADVGVCNALPS